MDWLCDTNIPLRMAQPDHPIHEEALQAVEKLIRAGDQVFIVAQNVAEFWNVATRPVSSNGLGFSVREAFAP